MVSAVAVLVAVLSRCSCRSADPQGEKTRVLPPPLPLLMRHGEEYFIRLDNAAAARATPRSRARDGGSADPDSRETTVNRALQLQLTQRTRRAEEPPISLDLTFHLLREVLEMARAEQIAQQADNNRKMMDIYGK